MRVTFIGTSHGIPEPGRKTSCTLLEAGGRKYILDMGADAMSELINRGIDPNLIKAVFITHLHGDHTNGLVSFTDLLGWFFKEADPEIFLPKLEAKDALDAWFRVNGSSLRETLRFTEEKEGVIFDDGVLKVTAVKTGHIDVSYAFIFEAEGKTLLFSGDMKYLDGPTADFERICEMFSPEDGFDLAVGECAHFPADDYLEILKKYRPKRFCFNHYSWRNEESCHKLRAALWGEILVTLVKDGYEIEL